ncbi:MAG: hypothetical protein ABSB11_06645 [Sedimentisphaerales bacterium]|jgi:hypothetical protein
MVDENKTGKYIAKTIALPALLVISLLTARLVMQSKTGIRMSAPVELNRSGLSVSMPLGNGWKCKEKWSFEDSSFNISSIFAVSGLDDRSYAQCRYLLAAGEETPTERLDQEYSGKKLFTTGQSTQGCLTANWATINTDAGIEIILGVCELADGRQLEIEVLQIASEQNTAKDIFEKIFKSIRFSDNGLLRAGARLISDIRNEGLDTARDNDSSVSFFTIADPHNKIIGFTMDAMALVRTDANTTINVADYYYLRGTIPDEQIGYFRGDANLRQFEWRVEASSRTGRKGIEMTADSDILMVRRLRAGSPFDKRTGKETGEYELGETAVPDIVLDPVLAKVLDINEQAVIIDIIRPDGAVMPVYIEKSPPAKDRTDSNSLRMEWLDGRNYWQQIYYDSSKKTTKTILGQETTYTLNISDANEITKLFPERANLVRDKSPILNREGI